jgi:hypothetical protein
MLDYSRWKVALEPNLIGAKITIGRGHLGPTINIISTGKPVSRTEADEGWAVTPERLKKKQFGQLQLEQRFLRHFRLNLRLTDCLTG